ncbi:hypothetical protein X764_19850 [Mesorhizobium sp. LSHC440A00]|nr:hypothetical protein X764_19850 [Mesorhizobium sp. LSHC440A00]
MVHDKRVRLQSAALAETAVDLLAVAAGEILDDDELHFSPSVELPPGTAN